ncbi:MAG: RNHCP domain-containing protein [Candidatus Taylorbacteria bacterium]|nr:RNHCP domain-containing protein [Candidatus Taylorbacteria bacterium]
MHKKLFIKKEEDFTCEKCDFFVNGNGYTNHCPNCLYSKHVDVFPGDRAESCGGLMKPVDVTGTQKEYIIRHKCIVCGYEKNNKVSEHDSIEVLASVAKNKGNI